MEYKIIKVYNEREIKWVCIICCRDEEKKGNRIWLLGVVNWGLVGW